MTPIDCESRIDRVVLYARGAVVTRRVDLPADLPEGPFDLRVPGLTVLADVGSLRATALGDREVTALRPRLAIPSAPARPGRLKAEARSLSSERQSLEADRGQLVWRRAEMAARALELSFSRWGNRPAPAARFADALALGGLLGAEVERLDTRIRELEEALTDNQRRTTAAELALAQGTTTDLLGEEQTRLEVMLRLGPLQANRARDAEGPRAIELEYVVAAARWWPAYTVRFSAQATRVSFTIDAFVAQASGEDWTRAKLSVSTADLAQDARLPELRSLRLGRAQPTPRRGYRPPPAGLEAMFEGYDRALGRLVASHALTPSEAKLARSFMCRSVLWDVFEELAREHDCSVDYLINESMKQYVRARSMVSRAPAQAGSTPPPPPAAGYGAPPPQMAARSAPPLPMGSAMPSAPFVAPGPGGPTRTVQTAISANAPQSRAAQIDTALSLPRPDPAALWLNQQEKGKSARGSARMRQSASEDLLDEDSSETANTVLGGYQASSLLAEAAIEPGDAWLDFDALMIADPKDHARRGRLMREEAVGPGARADDARAAIDALDGPPETRDPLETRGRFDHRYDAEGVADVPSSGRPHRVAIATAEASAKPRFVAVPREAAEVYREVEIQNPFAAPLLSGPVEVFIDGALLTTSSLSFVDRRGVLHLGLGVEDRLRVARNARVQEASAGLLGGSTAVEHVITIDVASSLGQKVAVDVVDRVPVTDDKDIDVKILYSRPEADKYAQTERGAPIRRGLRFRIEVPPGDKQRIEFAYRVTLPAKNELVGGNRRE
jgi:hypothetical protein